MKESEIKTGMYVLISDSNATSNTHTSTRIMRSMVGEIHKIEYTAPTRHGLAAVINEYYWHPSDLSFPKHKKEKPKTENFDTKELVI